MNTTDIINPSDNIQPAANAEPEYTIDTLPELSPQQALMLDYILQGYNYTTAYRMAKYTDSEWSSRSAYLMINRNPLKAHIEFFINGMAKRCTPEYKINFLNRIAEQCTNPENAIKNADSAIKAIDLMAKIQGHHAQTGNTNIQINTSIEDIRNAKQQYIKDK